MAGDRGGGGSRQLCELASRPPARARRVRGGRGARGGGGGGARGRPPPPRFLRGRGGSLSRSRERRLGLAPLLLPAPPASVRFQKAGAARATRSGRPGPSAGRGSQPPAAASRHARLPHFRPRDRSHRSRRALRLSGRAGGGGSRVRKAFSPRPPRTPGSVTLLPAGAAAPARAGHERRPLPSTAPYQREGKEKGGRKGMK